MTAIGWVVTRPAIDRHLIALTEAHPLVGPVATVPAGAVPPTHVGVNLSSVVWYSGERVFANLVVGGYWALGTNDGWKDYDPANLNPDGSLKTVPAGFQAMRMLVRPDTGQKEARFRCTYTGKGKIEVGGFATDVFASPGKIDFRWNNTWADTNVWLNVSGSDPKQPISNIDCRETAMPKDARFAPSFIASLKGYKALRFMDYEITNGNAPVAWATRHTPASIDITAGDGVSVEDMVAIANAADADPWFTIPWNADAAYVEGFARYVHDHVPPGRHIYVELGNEVWNGAFPMAQQAAREGAARGLGTGFDAQLRRYAQHTIEVMRVWEQVFADQPGRLVRVVSTQHVSPSTAEAVLGFPHLAQHVDALATAPYFGGDVMREGTTRDLDEIFRRLRGRIDETIAAARANKAVAARYGKRYVAYEAGQHVILDVPLEQQVERDPRMYDLYKTYIAAWRAQVGDTLMLFGSVGGISEHGAWGLAEHAGQSLADAPKLRAAIEERDR